MYFGSRRFKGRDVMGDAINLQHCRQPRRVKTLGTKLFFVMTSDVNRSAAFFLKTLFHVIMG